MSTRSPGAGSVSASMVASLWVFGLTCPALAEVDLLFEPSTQTVLLEVGDLVAVNLVAHSSDGSEQRITIIDAILAWDPAMLELLGVDDSNAGATWLVSGFLNDADGINQGISEPPVGVPDNDGDAIYTALAPPGAPASAGPDDLVVTSIQLRALQPTAATVVSFVPELGEFGQTRVFGEGKQNDITGDISATATIVIVGSACLTDFDHDGQVNASDLALLLSTWGPCPEPCVPDEPSDICPTDLDQNCNTDASDLASLLADWGPCS